MSASISELRNRNRVAREMVAIQEQRIRSVVVNELRSSKMEEGACQSVAASISSKVTDVVSNTVNQFLDQCQARGLRPSEIRRAVGIVNNAFGLADENAEYDVVLQRVADYMIEHTNLYDEFQPFLGNSNKNN